MTIPAAEITGSLALAADKAIGNGATSAKV
jgi:hypothetical protein